MNQIAYNSCRNRHCPKCQASAAQRWLEARTADLLPVEYVAPANLGIGLSRITRLRKFTHAPRLQSP